MDDNRQIDLHAHTTHSDGTLSPTELVEKAAEIGLAALAVTDHDITSALEEAHAAGDRLGVEILDGCEISTSLPSGVVHILTYGFDVEDADFQGFLADVRTEREARNDALLDKLRELKLPLDRADVAKHAVGQIIARPHFALAMVEAGYVDDVREAFKRYLHDNGPAYVRAQMPEPEAGIEAAVRAGGVAVVAHPRSMKLGGKAKYRAVLERYREAGLAGIEVDHPSHDAGMRRTFAELAADLDLVPSGGSDFHGAAKPHIRLGEGDGTIHVTYGTWRRLAAHARS